MISKDTILDQTIFVAKMQGWRSVGTFREVGHLLDDPDCRDFDLCAEQPDHLKDFYDKYWAFRGKHGFIDPCEYYDGHYAKGVS